MVKLKYIKQSLVYILEVSVIATLFMWLTTYLTPIGSKYEALERIFTGIVLYQGLIFLFNRNSLDVERDMIISYKTYLKLCKLYVETNSSKVLDKIKIKLEKLNNGSYLIGEDYLNAMNVIYSIIINKNFSKNEALLNIELELISCEHIWEYEAFIWRQSLLLKFLK